MNALIREKGGTFSLNKNEPIHRWYSYIEGYSSCLIAEELKMLLSLQPDIKTIYDPYTVEHFLCIHHERRQTLLLAQKQPLHYHY